ncbi:MHYT domain-containing protein [Streptomyces sp. NPDC091209]|uniref:MHYT domain-containing protein n=1 Tax=Streptomyces sp. NPDC091209 TaxID=3365974 RepID=UPI00380909DD
MNGTIDGFSYGLVTPVAAYVMACVGSALGLRCVVRTVHHEPGWRLGWLALGASALGCGIWTMHFIAMTGFSVAETPITYNVPLTVLSLVVAIVVVSAGVFIVGHRGATRAALTVGGSITGLGVATMHYLGMFAMHLNGELRYNAFTVTLSVIIALVAATAALWAAVSVQGFLRTLGASLVMGLAVTGMHYTGMAAVSVHLHNGIGATSGGKDSASLLLPMLLGPIIFLILAAAIVMFDPVLILGDGDWDKSAQGRSKVVARGNLMQVRVSGAETSSAPMAHAGRQADGWSSAAPQWPAAAESAPNYSDTGAGDPYGARYEAE